MLTAQEMATIETEVKKGLETGMVDFCEKNSITKGWSVAQHAKFQFGEVRDIVDSGDAITEDDRNFRIFITLRLTANYSAWRQAHEGDGKPLQAGTGRGAKSLAAEYI